MIETAGRCRTARTGANTAPFRSVFQKKLAGFTLIELMIVVTVVGIIAALAWPVYTDQVRKARRSHAKAALLDTAARLEQFFLDNKTYRLGADGTDLALLGLPVPFDTVDGGWYRITAVTNVTPYVLTATPRLGQAADLKCASFTFNQLQQKQVNGTYALTPEKCW